MNLHSAFKRIKLAEITDYIELLFFRDGTCLLRTSFQCVLKIFRPLASSQSDISQSSKFTFIHFFFFFFFFFTFFVPTSSIARRSFPSYHVVRKDASLQLRMRSRETIAERMLLDKCFFIQRFLFARFSSLLVEFHRYNLYVYSLLKI